jgi:hypothetical protein
MGLSMPPLECPQMWDKNRQGIFQGQSALDMSKVRPATSAFPYIHHRKRSCDIGPFYGAV